MKTTTPMYELIDVNSRELRIIPEYQRKLKRQRVTQIANDFNEFIANEPKVSFRDGHYYVFDGQHTIAARKMMNRGQDLRILCKVYRGLTISQEAELFSRQTGYSAPLTSSAMIKALVFSGDPKATAFLHATELAGMNLGFDQVHGEKRIACINTAFSIFNDVGEEMYREGLKIINEAWNGASDALRAETLQGIFDFISIYQGEYSRKRLISKLRTVEPIAIYRGGRTDLNMPGSKKYLNQVYRIYNGSSKKSALPMRF